MSPRKRPTVATPDRAVIYVRQSTAREESISLEVQEAACRSYAEQRGYLVEAVVSDPGVSGLKWERRAGVQKVMRMVEAREVDVVLVWRWSRLSRNRLHQAVALDAVERAGGRVESATEPFDTSTAGGEFGRDVLLAAAAFESRQKGEQWREAHTRRLQNGLPHAGTQRLGYLYRDKTYVPDPETAPLVVELYERSTSGEGLRPLAAWLNSMGVTSPRTGKQWTPRGVAYLMRTGFAAGLLHVHDPDCRCGRPASCVRRIHVPGSHEAILDRRQWEAWQRAQRERSSTPARLRSPRHWLSGLVRCGSCGYGMRLKSDPRYGAAYMFSCEADGCEGRVQVTRARAERAAMERLRELADDVEQAAAVADAHRERKSSAQVEVKRLGRVVADADRAMVRLTKDRARGLVPEAAYRAALEELQRERDEAAARLDAFDMAASAPPPPSRARVRGLLAEWDTLSVGARRDMLALLLRVQVSRSGAGRPVVKAIKPQ